MGILIDQRSDNIDSIRQLVFGKSLSLRLYSGRLEVVIFMRYFAYQ